MAALPIHSVLPDLKVALSRHRNVVLQAPPGAGKSTVVPLELLREPWLAGRRILMLEPRRLAARAVAARMADTLGEPVGRTVGYRMRFDNRVGAGTRIEVITEGILAVLLHKDPALEGVGCVIFDEFHERSLQADLGLALCLDVQAHLNETLRLLAMSATLAAEPLAELMGAGAVRAPVVQASGRSYPVDIRYAAKGATRGAARSAPVSAATPADAGAIAREAAAAVRRALEEESGDVLAFLPGAGEIHRVAALLEQTGLPAGVRIAPLFGDLAREEQDGALAPSPAGQRKVVLATNIAETSLTIEGVRVVVDSGWARRARFDPASGMSRLQTLRISRASAQQRCGRAGRLQPGVCYRLWTEGQQQSMEAHTPAEILEADLASLALELAGWNVDDPRQLRWLDPPPAAPYAQACDLLHRLGALDVAGRLTAHGMQMRSLRLHPRLAHMLLRARDLDLSATACDLAALLGERDILRRGPGERDADVRVRLEALHRRGGDVDRAALERVRKAASQYRRQLGVPAAEHGGEDGAGILLALAYPDRIAHSRAAGAGRYRLSNGKGAFFAGPQSLARSEYLAVAELDGNEREARIFLAAALMPAHLEHTFADDIQTTEQVRWDAQQQAVLATRERRLGALVLDETALKQPDPAAVQAALIAGIRQLSLAALPWDRDTREWQARVQFVRAIESDPEQRELWPDVSDAALLDGLERWLAPWLDGMTRREHLSRLDLRVALQALLDWNQGQRLNELAPTHVTVPSGSNIRIDYLDGDTPSLSVRLQEVFGLHESPRVGGGKVALLIKLLSPARRPVQITRDLASFWRSGYLEVRKELKGRYPKHYWPDDPLQAEAVRGTRRPRVS